MSVSKIDIINKALHHLGCERINAITDQNKRARVMSDIYEITRRSALEDHFWKCARKRVELAALVTEPLFEYTYQFTKPSDCIKIEKEFDGNPYIVEGGKILANANALKIIYIWNLEDASLFSPGLCEALASKLARDACYSLIQSSERYNFLDRLYEGHLAMARANSDNQQPPEDIEISDFISLR